MDVALPRKSAKRSTSSKKSISASKLDDDSVDTPGILSRTASRIKAMRPFHGEYDPPPSDSTKGLHDSDQTLVDPKTILDEDLPVVGFQSMTHTNESPECEVAESRNAYFVKDSKFARDLLGNAARSKADKSEARTAEVDVFDTGNNQDQPDATDEIVIGESKLSYLAKSQFAQNLAQHLKCSKKFKRLTSGDNAKLASLEVGEFSNSVFMDKLLADLQLPAENANVGTGSASVSQSSTAASIVAGNTSVNLNEDVGFEAGKMMLFVALNIARESKDVINARTAQELDEAREQGRALSGDVRVEKLKFDSDLEADAQIAANAQDIMAAATRAKIIETGRVTDGKEVFAAALARRHQSPTEPKTDVNFIERNGYWQLIGPASYGALATGTSWAEGGHLLHAISRSGSHLRGKKPANDGETCGCDDHLVWSAITDPAYRYVGIARSRIEKQWIVHLAKERPSQQKQSQEHPNQENVSRLEVIRQIRESLQTDDPAESLAAEYQSQCVTDEEDEEHMHEQLQDWVRQTSIARKPLPLPPRPVIEGMEITSTERKTCDSVCMHGKCSFCLFPDGMPF